MKPFLLRSKRLDHAVVVLEQAQLLFFVGVILEDLHDTGSCFFPVGSLVLEQNVLDDFHMLAQIEDQKAHELLLFLFKRIAIRFHSE